MVASDIKKEQELGSHWPRVGQREYPSGITLVLVSTWQQYPSGTLQCTGAGQQ